MAILEGGTQLTVSAVSNKILKVGRLAAVNYEFFTFFPKFPAETEAASVQWCGFGPLLGEVTSGRVNKGGFSPSASSESPFRTRKLASVTCGDVPPRKVMAVYASF